MFDQAFSRVFGHGELALVLAVALVILSQLKINIMNAYSGSLSWSNFFSGCCTDTPAGSTGWSSRWRSAW